eukprot:TRINITY_DN2298_c0_g1_i1.p2 TRINITY_DN2298_c0_g1~~TRINITY_DN2298_c0_g1_i1.p2  ORF type:complete len:237 (-),score=23.00 TRINITY_DN2298_c0_g1_i1:877-1587(-)
MLGSICIIILIIVLNLLRVGMCQELKFWHYSDSHVDNLYKPNTLPLQLSCRIGDGTAGMFGDYSCDPPLVTQSEVIRQMSLIEPSPQFIIHTGDSQHNQPLSMEEVQNSIRNSTQELKKNFPNTTIIYAIGNHDVVPKDQILPFSSQLQQLSDVMKEFLTDEQLETFQKGGYYSTETGGYKILLVNTLLYYRWNNLVWNITTDIGDQFQFIKDELDAAVEKKLESTNCWSHFTWQK